MSFGWMVTALFVAACGSLVFSTLTYSLRAVSRVRLGDYLQRRGLGAWLEPTVTHSDELVFVTAVVRLVCNILIVLLSLHAFDRVFAGAAARYVCAAALAALVSLYFSVILPQVLAEHAGDSIVGACVRPLQVLRAVMSPLIGLMHLTDRLVSRATGGPSPTESTEIEQEILSVVEEGEKEGVVLEEEREMIESVIHFGSTTAGQIMTPRPDIIALDVESNLSQVKQTIEETGHSRIPVFKETMDQIVGVLYARDLLQFLGLPTQQFDIRTVLRPPLYVPETKPLPDLLRDFRLQKVHIAIVMDEYGGTAGLVTIEDIMEELVGDISDEHEPVEPAMFKRLDEQTSEVDARMYIDEVNRLTGLNLPDDEGYDTLGGFVSNTLGRIPETGTVFEQNGAKFTVLDAEPQKVNRVKIQQTLQPVTEADGRDLENSA